MCITLCKNTTVEGKEVNVMSVGKLVKMLQTTQSFVLHDGMQLLKITIKLPKERPLDKNHLRRFKPWYPLGLKSCFL